MSTEVDPEKTNPFKPGVSNPGMDEDIELHPISSCRRCSADPTGHHRTYVETSLGGDISDTTPLIEKESKRDDAWKIIHEKFPNHKTDVPPFTARIDEYGRVMLRLATQSNAIEHELFKPNGELNDKLPKTIKDYIVPPSEKIVENNEEEIARRNKKISELQDQLEKNF